jgi:hypothetical protein
MGEEKEILLHGEVCAYLTGRLMGDPEITVPMPAGSYVIHYANKVHYDGAKNEEAVIQVWGMGPATSTPAEKR